MNDGEKSRLKGTLFVKTNTWPTLTSSVVSAWVPICDSSQSEEIEE
jgi:hypothetical protein